MRRKKLGGVLPAHARILPSGWLQPLTKRVGCMQERPVGRCVWKVGLQPYSAYGSGSKAADGMLACIVRRSLSCRRHPVPGISSGVAMLIHVKCLALVPCKRMSHQIVSRPLHSPPATSEVHNVVVHAPACQPCNAVSRCSANHMCKLFMPAHTTKPINITQPQNHIHCNFVFLAAPRAMASSS